MGNRMVKLSITLLGIIIIFTSIIYIKDNRINVNADGDRSIDERYDFTTVIEDISKIEEKEDKHTYEERIEDLVHKNDFLRREVIRLGVEYEGRAKKIPVLLYHHLLLEKDIKKENDAIISAESFAEQMEWLYKNNYYTATMEELELYIEGKLELPKKTVVITFDDGYLSNLVYGYPILKKYGQKATIFMIGEKSIEAQEEFSPEGLQYINHEIVESYTDVFHFGSHTFDMHESIDNVVRLTNYNDDDVKIDLLKNEELFPTKYIAYPHGKYNKTTLKILEELDYKLGMAAGRGYAKRGSHKYKIPRFSILPGTSFNKFKRIVKPGLI